MPKGLSMKDSDSNKLPILRGMHNKNENMGKEDYQLINDD
jgi:hypothetical protein